MKPAPGKLFDRLSTWPPSAGVPWTQPIFCSPYQAISGATFALANRVTSFNFASAGVNSNTGRPSCVNGGTSS